MKYPPTSPYFTSRIVNNQYLDVMNNRFIPSMVADEYWSITPEFNLRPDLLAYSLYQESRLWWVFAQRNPNTLKDPLFDFKTGVKIYLPKLETIQAALNI